MQIATLRNVGLNAFGHSLRPGHYHGRSSPVLPTKRPLSFACVTVARYASCLLTDTSGVICDRTDAHQTPDAVIVAVGRWDRERASESEASWGLPHRLHRRWDREQ